MGFKWVSEIILPLGWLAGKGVREEGELRKSCWNLWDFDSPVKPVGLCFSWDILVQKWDFQPLFHVVFC